MSVKTDKTDKATDTFLVALDSVIAPNVKNYGQQIKLATGQVNRRASKKTPGAGVVESMTGSKPKITSGDRVFVNPNKNLTQGSAADKREKFTIRRMGTMAPGHRTFKFSLIDTIESARKGVSFDEFKSFYDLLNLTNKKWAEIIGVSDKTMQNIIKEKRFLDQNKSEKLLNFLLLVKYGLEVFGEKELFENWLNYQSPILEGTAPMEYLDTIQGVNLLKELLFKIESGNLI